LPAGTRALVVTDLLRPDRLATAISERWTEWENARNQWLAEKREIRNYIFATDTYNTSNGVLDWKNSTHVPKLCNIRDNLHANYMSALFPNDRPIRWEGDDETSEAYDKRLAIEAYMSNKMRQSNFRNEVSRIVLDYIDYGNCFGAIEFVAEKTKDGTTGEEIPGYVGPRLVRISPLDIVFNPTAASFEESPKIIRSLKTLASLKADIEDHPEAQYLEGVWGKIMEGRSKFVGLTTADFSKSQEFQIDGFSSFLSYFQGDYCELLDFYGDYYDENTGEFFKNQLITIVDRAHVIRNFTNPSWLGGAAIFHAGWRLRPDNLYAMGPLDNLVGMQYRIDHLENAKADAFDLVIHPVMKVKGLVEDFEYAPGERIFTGEEGDVEFMRADLQNILQADTQIAIYEAKMEEMAGAPKQAMGFRTPGEKTMYEVQVLENGANRVFLNKTAQFEETFLEKALNAMLEVARRNMGPSELIRVMDNDFGVVNFMKITREDIAARGKLRPIGARHFARNANLLQNLTQWYNSPIGQDPSVQAHISGKAMAKISEELLEVDRFGIVQDNIRVAEQLETQQLMQAGSNILANNGAPAGPEMAVPTAGSTGSAPAAPPRPVQ
jgi:hypothetical protein